MDNQELVAEINKNIPVVLSAESTRQQLQAQLGAYINQLIQTSFQKLISLLYRVDVSEAKLKQLLQEQPREDAGLLIAGLIIERQLEKIKTRQQFRPRQEDFSDEEKW